MLYAGLETNLPPRVLSPALRASFSPSCSFSDGSTESVSATSEDFRSDFKLAGVFWAPLFAGSVSFAGEAFGESDVDSAGAVSLAWGASSEFGAATLASLELSETLESTELAGAPNAPVNSKSPGRITSGNEKTLNQRQTTTRSADKIKPDSLTIFSSRSRAYSRSCTAAGPNAPT